MIKTRFSEKISFIMFENNEVKIIGVKSRFMIWNMEMYKMENIKQVYNHDLDNWRMMRSFGFRQKNSIYEIEQHCQINKNEE